MLREEEGAIALLRLAGNVRRAAKGNIRIFEGLTDKANGKEITEAAHEVSLAIRATPIGARMIEFCARVYAEELKSTGRTYIL